MAYNFVAFLAMACFIYFFGEQNDWTPATICLWGAFYFGEKVINAPPQKEHP